MRITTEGAGGIQLAYIPAASQVSARNPGMTRGTEGSFDQISISRGVSQESRFQRELAARIVGEVRTSVGSGRIRQLREQIQSGTYQIDASAIASAMLLER